jgi:hypothetical protein
MCKRCNITSDDTVVTRVAERTVLAWDQSISFTHAGHFFASTLTKDISHFYTLELENKADESLLGELITDQEFLDELAQLLTTEYKMREIFKTPHVFYIAEPDVSSTEVLPETTATPSQGSEGLPKTTATISLGPGGMHIDFPPGQ